MSTLHWHVVYVVSNVRERVISCWCAGHARGVGEWLGSRPARSVQAVGSQQRDVLAAARLSARNDLRVPHGTAVQGTDATMVGMQFVSFPPCLGLLPRRTVEIVVVVTYREQGNKETAAGYRQCIIKTYVTPTIFQQNGQRGSAGRWPGH